MRRATSSACQEEVFALMACARNEDPAAAMSAAHHLGGWAPDGVSIDVSVDGTITRIAAVENGADLDGWVNLSAAVAPQ